MPQALVSDKDEHWEQWGVMNPYYGVLSNDKFRKENLDENTLAEFFATGELHVAHVARKIEGVSGKPFAPGAVLDYGCGVGRLLLPFSRRADEVVGADVAPAMLAEAAVQCRRKGARNVSLVKVDDSLGSINRKFDLVHSFIVFQHIIPERGLILLERLLGLVQQDGAAAIHIVYGRRTGRHVYGTPVPTSSEQPAMSIRSTARAWVGQLIRLTAGPIPDPVPPVAVVSDPLMPMHTYEISKVFYLLEKAGFNRLDVDLLDHAGELGAMIYAARGNR